MSTPALGIAAGPEVGESVPAFEAIDQSGNARDFASLTGERGLLLLFYRSADW
jgi:peroxiredoxin